MRHGIDASPRRHRRRRATEGDWLMQWQTPTAIDFRFGFEITLYVAAR
jgi:coenzyme PQQ precursor peptide PqqA